MKLFKLGVKTYMIVFLSVLALFNISHMGFVVIKQTLGVVFFALIVDSVIIWLKEHKLKFSQSACISGLIIAELLTPHQSWPIYVFAPLFAIFSKHLIKISQRHIFNPAAFGLFLSQLFFPTGLAWWAANPVFLIIIFGLFIVYKMKRWELILGFLLTASLLFKGNLYLINPYFMFFMLTEPKTQPFTKKGRIIYAGLIGIFAFLGLALISNLDYSIFGLLLGNLSVPILNKWLK